MLDSLRKADIAHPSVVVLARTNALVGKLSTILGQEHNLNGQIIRPVEHDVLWDADLTAAAALVVASVLEWQSHPKEAALGQTFDRIADYFDAKVCCPVGANLPGRPASGTARPLTEHVEVRRSG